MNSFNAKGHSTLNLKPTTCQDNTSPSKKHPPYTTARLL